MSRGATLDLEQNSPYYYDLIKMKGSSILLV